MNHKHQKTNRLIHEKSPYLLQHAHNPVDWYPWGQEAFDAAKQLDKPIFLSIGYATCHWCHVMERESFEEEAVAELMNDVFINIKVDREELPEVDNIYMEFAQGMMAGVAGWPLNIILTPDLQPFFAATYLPPLTRHGLMGMQDLIVKIKNMWHGDEREQVVEQAKAIVDMFEKSVHVKGSSFPEKELVEEAMEILFKMADPIYGGIKGAPKFPIGYQLNLMLHYFLTSKDARSLFLVERTLDMMHRGGIYDHLGGGFSRYSTDEKWLIPHFEKMLYDNALMVSPYLECWQITKKPIYMQIVNEILGYILSKMTLSDGGFCSAEDADSEGHEGKFYTWSITEFQNILGVGDADLIAEYFGLTEKGNFEGKNVLHTPLNFKEFAEKKGISEEFLHLKIEESKKLLAQVRENREHPFKDDKVLTAWNGLMIYSILEAGLAFDDLKYIESALKAAKFIKAAMWQDGQLFRRFREGDVRFNAGLDEYAFMIRACISLFEANLGISWLIWAIEMTSVLEETFKEPSGAFYQTDGSDAHIILKKCRFSDGAEPSGNAVHTENLMRLYQLTSEVNYLEQAEDVFSAAKKYMGNYSPGYSYHMMNLNRFFDKHAPALVIALDENNSFEKELKKQIYSNFIPHKVVIWRHTNDKDLFRIIPYTKELIPIANKTTLYICFEGVCQKPIDDLSEMMEAIRKL